MRDNKGFDPYMNAIIYDKSDKGREEIATRKYLLTSRLRTLLVMIDGKQTVDSLLKKVAGLGLGDQSIQQLLDEEFIVAPLFVEPPSVAEEKEMLVITELPQRKTELDNVGMTDAQRFQALYNFFNETVKSTLGLRGFAMQLKVERAATVEDFQKMRNSYVEAVMKTKGNDMARSLRDRLDQLLYAGTQIQLDRIVPDE